MVWCQTPSRACAWHHTPRASAPHDPRLGAVEGWPKGIRADWAPRSSRPRTEAAQEREQCGHQDRAHDQRVDEDTQPHDECQRAEPPQQHQRQHREAGRRGEPGCGDGAGGVRDALRYGLAPRRVVGTGPDVADPVDVVVRAQPSSRSARPSDRRRVGRSACRRPAAVPAVLSARATAGLQASLTSALRAKARLRARILPSQRGVSQLVRNGGRTTSHWLVRSSSRGEVAAHRVVETGLLEGARHDLMVFDALPGGTCDPHPPGESTIAPNSDSGGMGLIDKVGPGAARHCA